MTTLDVFANLDRMIEAGEAQNNTGVPLPKPVTDVFDQLDQIVQSAPQPKPLVTDAEIFSGMDVNAVPDQIEIPAGTKPGRNVANPLSAEQRELQEGFQNLVVSEVSKAALRDDDNPPSVSQSFLKAFPGVSRESAQAASDRMWSAYQKAKQIVRSEELTPASRDREATARYHARDVSDEDMPALLFALDDVAKQRGVQKDKSFLRRTGEAGLKGLQDLRDIPVKTVRMFTDDPAERARAEQIEAVLHGADPTSGRDTGFLGKGFLAAMEQAPSLLGAQGTASAAGRLVGAGTRAAKVASPVAGAAFYSPILIEDAYGEMLAEGIDKDKARTGSLVSGVIESAIETLALNVVLPPPLRKIAGGKARNYIFQGLKERGLTFATELFEEGAQGFARAVTKEVQDDVDADTMDALTRSLKTGLDQAKGSIGALLFLTGPGSVSQVYRGKKLNDAEKAMMKSLALAPETAQQIAQQQPESVEKVLSAENPAARKTIKDVSTELAKALPDKASREKFVENLKAAQEVESFAGEFAEQQLQSVPAESQQQIPDPPADAVSVDELASASRRGATMLKSFVNKWFTKEGNLPSDAWKSNRDRVGEVNAIMSDIKFVRSDFKKAIKEAYGTKNISPEQHEAINNALATGMEAIQQLPEALRDVVGRMRTQVDALSKGLIDMGVVQGDLAAVIGSNLDVYLNRTYQAFTDPKWKDKVKPEVYNKAMSSVRQDFPELNENEVRGLVDNLLEVGKAGDSPVAAFTSGKLGAKELGILKKRSGIPEPIRELLGENKNAYVNYANSVAKIGKLIASHQMLSNVREVGEGSFLFTAPTTNENGQFIYPVAAEGSESYSPINGMYTTKEIAESLNQTSQFKALPTWLRWYMKVLGTSKVAKTVWSAQTQVRNFAANPIIALANGNFNVFKTRESLMANLASVNIGKNSEWREYFKRLQRLGVVSDTAQAGELRDIVQDAMGEDANEFLLKDRDRAYRAITRGAAEAYRIGDDFWKVYAFENERAKYRKAYPEWTDEQLDEYAAEIVRNTVPTYSMIPKAIQNLRRLPLVAPFVSFVYEIFRITPRQLMQVQKELSDPKTRSIGIQRAIGLMSAHSFGVALAAAFRYLHGVSKEEDEDVRHFVAPWSENSNLIHTGRDAEGNRGIIDISYTNPYSYLGKPVRALLRGENWEDALHSAVGEIADPFISEELVTERVFDISRNTKKSGGQIWNPADSDAEKAAKIALHLFDPLIPGTATSINRIRKGLTGHVEEYGKTYDSKDELLAVVTGQRRSDANIPQSLGFRARDFRDQMSNAQRIVSKTALNRGNVSDEDIRAAYENGENARVKAFNEMHGHVLAAMRLGMSEREVRNVLKDRGISLDMARRLVSGNYKKYRPGNTFMRGLNGDKRVHRKRVIHQLSRQ